MTAVATSVFLFLKPCHRFIDNFQLPFSELTRPAPERASLRSPSTTATFPMPSKSSAVASVSSPTLQKKQSHTKLKSHSTMNKSQVRQLATKSLSLFPIHSRFFTGSPFLCRVTDGSSESTGVSYERGVASVASHGIGTGSHSKVN